MDGKDVSAAAFCTYVLVGALVVFGNIQGCVTRMRYNQYTIEERSEVAEEYIGKAIFWPFIAGYGAYNNVFESEWVKHEETENVEPIR